MVTKAQTDIADFERFTALPENADRLFELVDGEIIEKVPTELHGILAMLLAGEIYIYLKNNPIGRAGVEIRYQLPADQHHAYIPDIAFVSNDRALPIVESGAVPLMPDLAIEIASPDDRPLQMRQKALYYLKNGSRMVWLLFPAKKQIEVHTAESIRTLELGDTLDGGDVLPGFKLALKDIFKA